MWITSPWLTVRGHRNYIRGVDFYSSTIDLLESSGATNFRSLSLRFPRFSTKVGQLVLAGSDSFDKSKWKASPVRIGVMTQENTDLRGWYEEQDTEAQRISGEENKLVERWEAENKGSMSINGDELLVRGNSHIPAIEIIVSANKFYLQKRFSGLPGQWAFSGLDISRVFRKADSQDIRILFMGDHETKTTSSSIFANGEHVGMLLFSRIT